MQDFRDLKVWQKAHEIVLAIYRASTNFPSDERFGLTSQLRRAAVSIPANIAEGTLRSSDADFAHFLHIALGSAGEVDYYLLLARDLKFIEPDKHSVLDASLQEVKRMLAALTARVKQDAKSA
ncbi:MAG TPA: four helix bundle protein [Stellaceae bacterium]|nr:four helix bundle protein [Stellaceae bacterium]